jgi:hypothetical protein
VISLDDNDDMPNDCNNHCNGVFDDLGIVAAAAIAAVEEVSIARNTNCWFTNLQIHHQTHNTNTTY